MTKIYKIYNIFFFVLILLYITMKRIVLDSIENLFALQWLKDKTNKVNKIIQFVKLFDFIIY